MGERGWNTKGGHASVIFFFSRQTSKINQSMYLVIIEEGVKYLTPFNILYQQEVGDDDAHIYPLATKHEVDNERVIWYVSFSCIHE